MSLTPDLLLNLRASAEQEVGTENGTVLTEGPLRQCKAVINISAISGNLTAKVQQSDDNSTFYDVPGGGFLDPSDGAVMDEVGQYEVLVDITMRYVRINGVVASDIVTWDCYLDVIK